MKNSQEIVTIQKDHPEAKKRIVTPKWAHLVAGGAGGMLGAFLTSPLEVVKTRLQANRNKATLQVKFHFGLGTFKALSVLLKEEGLRGFYRGLGPHLIGVIPSRGIYFFTYGSVKSNLVEKFNYDERSSMASLISGVSAGFVVVTTMQPIWLIKTRMQLQSKTHELKYNNSLDAIKKMYRDEGIRVFYRGMSASYLGITESTLQFVLYEKLKQMARPEGIDEKLTTAEYLITASIAKLIAATATYPHEVIRTRLREVDNVKYKGLFSGLATIAREEGIKGLYGGIGPHLWRVVPNAAIMFMTYETVLRALSKEK